MPQLSNFCSWSVLLGKRSAALGGLAPPRIHPDAPAHVPPASNALPAISLHARPVAQTWKTTGPTNLNAPDSPHRDRRRHPRAMMENAAMATSPVELGSGITSMISKPSPPRLVICRPPAPGTSAPSGSSKNWPDASSVPSISVIAGSVQIVSHFFLFGGSVSLVWLLFAFHRAGSGTAAA